MSRDFFLREIGIELLASACRVWVLCHAQFDGPFVIEPHHHDDVLQFDLVGGCRGRVCSEGRWLGFDGPIALASYPGSTHGYTVEPIGADAVVYNLKLGPRSSLESMKMKPFPAFTTAHDPALFSAASGAFDPLGMSDYPEFTAVLGLLQLFAIWPDRGGGPVRRDRSTEIDPVVEQAVTVIESCLSEPMGLDGLGRACGVSGRQLARVFERATGMSPHGYATVRRLDRAKTLLLRHGTGVSEVADSIGFSSHATFTRWFSRHTGMTPSEFRSNPAVF